LWRICFSTFLQNLLSKSVMALNSWRKISTELWIPSVQLYGKGSMELNQLLLEMALHLCDGIAQAISTFSNTLLVSSSVLVHFRWKNNVLDGILKCLYVTHFTHIWRAPIKLTIDRSVDVKFDILSRASCLYLCILLIDCHIGSVFVWADIESTPPNGSELWVFFWLDRPPTLGRVNSIQNPPELGSAWQSQATLSAKKNTANQLMFNVKLSHYSYVDNYLTDGTI